MTSLRYEFQQGSQGIPQVIKDVLTVPRILQHLTADVPVVKLSLEPAQEANLEFSL